MTIDWVQWATSRHLCQNSRKVSGRSLSLHTDGLPSDDKNWWIILRPAIQRGYVTGNSRALPSNRRDREAFWYPERKNTAGWGQYLTYPFLILLLCISRKWSLSRWCIISLRWCVWLQRVSLKVRFSWCFHEPVRLDGGGNGTIS